MRILQVILILIFVVSIISGCSGDKIDKSTDVPVKSIDVLSPSNTIKMFEKAFNNADVNTINQVTTDKFRVELSREIDISDAEAMKNFFEQEGISSIEYDIEEENKISDSSVKVIFNTKFHTDSGQATEQKDAFLLVKVNNKWFIDETASVAEFAPSRCGFDNERNGLSTIYCNNFQIASKGVEFGISGFCNTVKASDCPKIIFNKLKVSGTCAEELIEIKSLGNSVCSSGLTSGQLVDLNLELSYSENGVKKTINGKLTGKAE
jgi:hypothetical protein